MVAYHFDANAILVHPLKNREAQTLTTAWTTLNQRFAKAGVAPSTYVMDNEISNLLRQALTKSASIGN